MKKRKRIPLFAYYPIVIVAVLLATIILALFLSNSASVQKVNPIKTINPSVPSPTPTASGVVEATGVLYPYQASGQWGYKNTQGEVVIAASFDDAALFTGEVAFAGKKTDGVLLYGLIDRQGRYVVQPSYEAFLPFSENLAAVKKDNLWGYIDASGQPIIPFSYEQANSFSEGLAMVQQNGRCGYIDASGETAIPFSYLKGNDFSEGKAFVCLSGESCNVIIDQKGKVLFTLMGDGTQYLQGLAKVSVDNKVYYLNTDYKIAFDITPPSEGGSFANGLAPVKTGGTWGYTDQLGQIVIEAVYEEALPFTGELAAVKKDGKYGYIDQTGEVVVPYSYDSAQSFQNDYALVTQNGKAGLIDQYGNFTFLYNTVQSNGDS